MPLYSDLISKKKLTNKEVNRVGKIRDIYDNFHADPEASRYLINSDILARIKLVYQIIDKGQRLTPENLYEYDKFIRESDRLIDTWNHQMMN